MFDFLYGFFLLFITTLLSWPLGRWMVWLLRPQTSKESTPLARWLGRLLGSSVLKNQSWQSYARSLLIFNALMFVFAFLILIMQDKLPLNPEGKSAIETSLAFHTSVSFTTNTNLQHYSGEQALSYLSQLMGLTWLQFVSAATGIAALAAMARLLGASRQAGNFFYDVFCITAFLLIPLALIWGLGFVAMGVPMTFAGAAEVTTVEGFAQTIARGPVAAMIAIKQLGTNGGGYFGPNSTHPFENPSFYTAVWSNMAIFVIPMACVWMFGHLIGRMKQAVVIYAVMMGLCLAMMAAVCSFEAQANPVFLSLGMDPSWVNLEGKELRFGSASAPVWAVSTTVTSNGSVSAMHDSLQPLTGLLALLGMWLNNVFGGVGVGMINMFLYIILAVFIAGLMVGRTPEYLNRKIEVPEMRLAILALLLHPLLILAGTAVFATSPWGVATIANPGSHGFTEILYEMTSASANNGSGFEGLADNTIPWNVATGVIMMLARYVPILLPLAIAGLLASKKSIPETSGTLKTDTTLFGFLLVSTVILLGALLFLPVAVLGPIAEHLSM